MARMIYSKPDGRPCHVCVRSTDEHSVVSRATSQVTGRGPFTIRAVTVSAVLTAGSTYRSHGHAGTGLCHLAPVRVCAGAAWGGPSFSRTASPTSPSSCRVPGCDSMPPPHRRRCSHCPVKERGIRLHSVIVGGPVRKVPRSAAKSVAHPGVVLRPAGTPTARRVVDERY